MSAKTWHCDWQSDGLSIHAHGRITTNMSNFGFVPCIKCVIVKHFVKCTVKTVVHYLKLENGRIVDGAWFHWYINLI